MLQPCDTIEDCPVWHTCRRGSCQLPVKACPRDCNGHGSCVVVDTSGQFAAGEKVLVSLFILLRFTPHTKLTRGPHSVFPLTDDNNNNLYLRDTRETTSATQTILPVAWCVSVMRTTTAIVAIWTPMGHSKGSRLGCWPRRTWKPWWALYVSRKTGPWS